MNERLSPCPFCGSEAWTFIYAGSPAVACKTCPAFMGGEESTATDDELRAAWNRRAGELPRVGDGEA